jgi:hypothetical protein
MDSVSDRGRCSSVLRRGVEWTILSTLVRFLLPTVQDLPRCTGNLIYFDLHLTAQMTAGSISNSLIEEAFAGVNRHTSLTGHISSTKIWAMFLISLEGCSWPVLLKDLSEWAPSSGLSCSRRLGGRVDNWHRRGRAMCQYMANERHAGMVVAGREMSNPNAQSRGGIPQAVCLVWEKGG